MPYKISGTMSEEARLIVFDESDWSIESNTVISGGGVYEIEVVSGTKTLLSRIENGWSIGYGDVSPEYDEPEQPAGGDEAIFCGGYINAPVDAYSNTIDYITISTPGNASDFGDLTSSKGLGASCSNGASDRGCYAGGNNPPITTIDYVTISTTGDAASFGDLLTGLRTNAGTSNGTNDRGLFGGGKSSAPGDEDTIEYITVSTTGNSADFGDLTVGRDILGALSNDTNNRGIFAGGQGSLNIIDYVTINSIGNATDFGDLTTARGYFEGCSNGTNERGIFGGGYTTVNTNVIDYITITTPGNSTDFGDLTLARRYLGSTSNNTNERAVFAGGRTTIDIDTIDYITISTPGNATDFGDLSVAREGNPSGSSNA